MNLKLFIRDRMPSPVVRSIQDFRFARKIRSTTENDSPDFLIIKHLVARGDVVIDIGANMGFYTKVLSDLVGMRGAVCSVEPIPSTFQRLTYIVHKLNLENVTLLNYALSDHNGTALMDIPLAPSGEENYFEAQIVPDGQPVSERSLIVRVTQLDEVLPETFRSVSFIKCDVEGHELECLRGADRVLRQSQPALMVEIWGDLNAKGTRASQTERLLESYGYTAYWFDGERLKRGSSGAGSTNYFFLLANHVARLKEQGFEFVEGD